MHKQHFVLQIALRGVPVPPLNYRGKAKIIATRVLKLSEADGDVDIAIRLFAPEAANDAWWCQYEVDWPEGRHQMKAWGTDAIQAIVLALQMIGAELYTSSYHKSGKLRLDTPGRGYGFPVPAGIRHLLEGDDATYGA